MSMAPLAAALAALAVAAALALAFARTRVASAAAFAQVGLFSGLAAASLGAANAGIALALAAAMLAALTLAAGGEAEVVRAPTPRVAMAAAVLAGLVLAASWPLAPALAVHRAAPLPAFDLTRGGDLFLALGALVGVGAAVAATLGLGERGVLGVRERAE